jgi:ABC-type branched-subunit amino acid transport system substrate-binding protein
MINATGAKALIIVQRHDTYGDALENATEANWKAMGGVFIDKIQYDQNAGSGFDFTSVVQTLNTKFQSANLAYPGKVAMDFISFEEFGQLIIKANSIAPNLLNQNLPWFGTDGEAQDTVITGNVTAGPLVQKVRLPSTVFGFLNNTKSTTLATTFAAAHSGNVCDNYCRGTYDDMWLGALATLNAGAYDGTRIQANMLATAANYYGVTGPTGLEASGDRIATIYQIYKVASVGGSPNWVFAGTWDKTTNKITPSPFVV